MLKEIKMKIDNKQWKWTREPKDFTISEDKIEIITNPHTDLWQRTYYHFRTISGNPRQFNNRDESAGVCMSAHSK